ncbi:unnamed protein product [Rotaria sordida]|uniref:Uncharacterized protein n=1 Tax=Rotaria sordida TaxID=392033 RepID=A0A819J3B0_9BILA|nr:unnamed protein product [Rotaria sordida]CAF1409765.1 unnamed protein product [Rotaria sordida]CAF3911976.1 unnamed protein product [Rotaria sordida]CAF3926796.1 unnamed protein product [Rotaria sordida]
MHLQIDMREKCLGKNLVDTRNNTNLAMGSSDNYLNHPIKEEPMDMTEEIIRRNAEESEKLFFQQFSIDSV